MPRRGSKNLFSIATIFASFFGAAMIAGAFAYYNYKFSKFKFIDFNQFTFYTSNDVFKPQDDSYIVVFFSSKDKKSLENIKKLKLNNQVLAIDYYNKNIQSYRDILFLRSGTNTTIKFIQRFNIYDVPVMFLIKKVSKNLYKQDSDIRVFDNLDDLSKYIEGEM